MKKTTISSPGRCWIGKQSILLLVVLLGHATQCATAADDFAIQTRSGEYQFRELTEPRPNRVHILRVNLAAGNAEVAVVVAPDPDGDGPAEAALTDPLKLASSPGVLAFINTNPWDSFPDSGGHKNHEWYEGQSVNITGLAVTKGSVRSPAGGSLISVWADALGRMHIGNAPTNPPPREAVAGWGQIVSNGAVIARLAKAPTNGKLNPVTGLGVDRTGETLWLVVVDGRQTGYSEGLTHYELACLLRDLGCWDGALMDGGGSSIMGLAGTDGQLRVVNSPSDRSLGLFPKIRPLPLILTIREISQTNSTRSVP